MINFSACGIADSTGRRMCRVCFGMNYGCAIHSIGVQIRFRKCRACRFCPCGSVKKDLPGNRAQNAGCLYTNLNKRS